jgi:hypothetical protein
MTVLQQEHRVHGAAKKAIAHQRQDELAQGGIDGASVEVCPSRESRGGDLAHFPVVTQAHRFSL